MAHQQHFSEALMRRFNDMMQENTQLQLQLARQHDEIATLQGQLHRGQFNSNLPPNVQALQHQVHDLQSQLLIAKERTQAAETRLKDSVTRFNSAYAEQRDCIKGLERQLKELKPVGSGLKKRVKGGDSELASTKADLKRTKSNFARLQKQFEAEKLGHTAVGDFPVGDCGKERRLEGDDQDDEEPSNAFMKQEPVLEELERQQSSLPTFQEPIVVDDPVTIKSEPGLEMTSESQMGAPTVPTMIKEESSAVQGSPAADATPPLDNTDVPRRDSSVIEVIHATTLSNNSTSDSPITEDEPVMIARSVSAARDETPLTTPRSTRASSRKIKSEPSTPPPPKTRKRRRLTPDELADQEVIDLERPPKRTRTRSSKSDAIAHLKETFEFNAVTEHHPDGHISALDSKEDLRDQIPELWELIHQAHTAWGKDWRNEFEENKPCVEACVSEKMKGEESVWREGGEGKFACKACVEHGRPCFAWTGEEFWLLPLHEDDRKEAVEEGEEMRWWVNDK